MSSENEDLRASMGDAGRSGEMPPYGTPGWVPLATFGLTWRVQDGSLGAHAQQGMELDVSLDVLWGHQELVYEPRVRQLAALSTSAFVGIDAIPVIGWSDGTYQLMGHHRAAAAAVRGDQTARVRIVGAGTIRPVGA